MVLRPTDDNRWLEEEENHLPGQAEKSGNKLLP